MSVWSRDFTLKEKLLMLFLVLVLIGLGYYFFFFQPVKEGIEVANADRDMALAELQNVQAQIDRLAAMQAELENLDHYGYLASYNNSPEELTLLNDILSDTLQYSISFSNVSRSGDLIRRNFSLSFKTEDYATMRSIVKSLCTSNLRCVIGNMSWSAGSELDEPATVSTTATFYETMVGGTPDMGLPADSAGVN